MADVPPTKTLVENTTWKVTAVHGEPREWTASKGGKMLSYRITIEAGERKLERVELAQRETTAAPKVGDEIEGSVEQRHYESGGEVKSDLKLKKATGGYGGGGGRAWKPRPDDAPVIYAARQAQIVAQHSQDMAMRVLELSRKSGESPVEIMELLGVSQEDADGNPLGLVDAFQRHAGKSAATAWAREAESGMIAKALAEIS